MCKYERGGNLCRCDAVHFAGKRTVEGASEEEWQPGEEVKEGEEGDEERGEEDWMDDRLQEIMLALSKGFNPRYKSQKRWVVLQRRVLIKYLLIDICSRINCLWNVFLMGILKRSAGREDTIKFTDFHWTDFLRRFILLYNNRFSALYK